MTFHSTRTDISGRIGLAAIRALHAEVALHPKPGLVTPRDNGAHRDMDMTTFLRSLFALRSYFIRIARAGAEGAPFADLQRLGIAAEARMLAATGGINTHRGAIFSLGLLAAAAGWRMQRGMGATQLCQTVADRWGTEIRSMASDPSSHGTRARRRHGVSGARGEAAAGFPLLRDLVHPALERALPQGVQAAQVQALFTAMAHLADTNLLHRGGTEGLALVQAEARTFLEGGGVFAPGWQGRAEALHRTFVARNLSPGGSADMLACAIFLHRPVA
ncbi:triphosphoribosyl-dephospho-CoA synthase MdcB [Falsirhodobacter sp. 1013]|uniref:triphosphoribosyl-dephospho-CoA synthase MdcB n=1 Tax=Falsirhodobacter sp. 1013 TaxID=3417566 RepID=UPI003EC0E910